MASCLAKDREERFQSAHDVHLQLKGIARAPSSGAITQAAQRALGPRLLSLSGAVLLALAVILFYLSRSANAPELSVRAYIPPPPQNTFRASGFDAGPVVVSPDGKTLAFSAIDDKGRTNLWLRPLDAQQATMLPSTEDAATPFWSPDGHYLAFVADRKLKKISTSGGDAQTLAEDSSWRQWRLECGRYHSILQTKLRPHLADTGLRRIDPARDQPLKNVRLQMYDPSFFPDGKHFFYISHQLEGPAQIKVGTIGQPQQDGVVVGPGHRAAFASGRLLLVQRRTHRGSAL